MAAATSNRAPSALVNVWLSVGNRDLMRLRRIRQIRGIPDPDWGASTNDLYGFVELRLEELVRTRSYNPYRSALSHAALSTALNARSNLDMAHALRQHVNIPGAELLPMGANWEEAIRISVLTDTLNEIREEVRNIFFEAAQERADEAAAADDEDEEVEEEEQREISYDLADHLSEGEVEEEEDPPPLPPPPPPPPPQEEDDPPALPPVRTPSREAYYNRYISDALELARQIRQSGSGNFPSALMREQAQRRREELPRLVNRSAPIEDVDWEEVQTQLVNSRGSAAEEAQRRIS